MEWVQEQKGPWVLGIVELTRRLVEAQPDSAVGWEKLGNAQRIAGDMEGSVATFREACTRFPENAELHLQLAAGEKAMGRFEPALDAVGTALRLEPELEPARDLQLFLLIKLGKKELAEELLAKHMASPAPSPAFLDFAMSCARGREDWQSLLTLCESVLSVNPGNTGARYYRTFALVRLGRIQEVDLDPAQFLSIVSLPIPESRTKAEFCAEVREDILANPTLVSDPRGKSTRQGLQTRELIQPGNKAIPVLSAQIQLAIDRYEQLQVASGVTDPFIAARPARVSLASWAVVYPGGGRQLSHFHPSGWLSGVYYVAAPPGGELLLGAMDEDDAAGVPWPVKKIQPEPNMLVLFPSFIPHATQETHSDDLRICVAFDVVPE